MAEGRRRLLLVGTCLVAIGFAVAGTGAVPAETLELPLVNEDPREMLPASWVPGSGDGSPADGGDGGTGTGRPTDPGPGDPAEGSSGEAPGGTGPGPPETLATPESGRTQSEAVVGGNLRRQSSTRIAGALDGLSPRVVFVASARRSGYWRTSAFTNYTGQGWRSPSFSVEYDPPAVQLPGDYGRTVVQTIRPRVPMRAVPALYAPRLVSTDAPGEVRVGPTGGVTLTEPVAPNGTVRVTSAVERTTVPDLRAAGRDYPRSVETRYATLPETVPDRLGSRTSEVVAGTDSPYAAVRAVEAYLEREKSYSLNVSRPEGQIADSFLFEMDRGYCQYFATTMAVMLRSQGIPARYVTGYTGGQPAGENTYVVRGMNAHAWVEVYFPGEGWVRFDPTPADPRRNDERRALGEARVRNLSDVDTPGTRDRPYRSPGDQRPSARSPTDDGTGDGETTAPVEVSVDPDPVPGREVTVTVQRADDPVSGARVLFNGEPVGTTGTDGTVTARVPYTDALDVTVKPPDQVGALAHAGIAGGPGAGAAGPGGSVAFGGDAATPPNGSGNASYSLPTDATFSVSSRVAGTKTTLTATIDGVALSGVPVSIDGTVVGRTDDDGTLTFEFPYELAVRISLERGSVSATRRLNLSGETTVGTRTPAVPGDVTNITATIAGGPVDGAAVSVGGRPLGRTDATGAVPYEVPFERSVTVTVERGDFRVSDRVAVARLNISVEGAAAASSATVRVSAAGTPVENVTVSVDGEPVGSTGPDGTATVSLGLANAATVSASRGALSASKRLTGLYEPYLPYAAAAAVGLGLVVVGWRRSDDAVGPLAGAVEVVVAALVTAGGVLERVGTRLRGGLSGLWGPASLAADLSGLLAALRAPVGGVTGRARAVLAWARSVPGRLLTRTGGDTDPDEGPHPGPPGPVPETDPGADGDGEESDRSVRVAWTWVERNTTVYDRRTRTPGEIAREAEAKGLPGEAVGDLLRAYRTVVYAERRLDPADRRRAVEALETIRESVRSSGGERR